MILVAAEDEGLRRDDAELDATGDGAGTCRHLNKVMDLLGIPIYRSPWFQPDLQKSMVSNRFIEVHNLGVT